MISGDSKRCAISTENGCIGCNWSEDDKIGLGNCEVVSKDNFDFSFKTQLRKAKNHKDPWTNEGSKNDLVQKKIKFIENKINYAFLKADMVELTAIMKVYLMNKSLYEKGSENFNSFDFYDRAKTIINDNQLNIEV